ncbi:hypothetical protein WG68_09805 [Arsukibacterium ikkense]|uniref:Uncharacterized protein n=1 Tax=Arsukibacterium ikkense TaxID=336831 RepID=A0A0M2V924_9GAMM|nr:hypothetical protein WG68_09805 [Arsukibacterium ikkense]
MNLLSTLFLKKRFDCCKSKHRVIFAANTPFYAAAQVVQPWPSIVTIALTLFLAILDLLCR